MNTQTIACSETKQEKRIGTAYGFFYYPGRTEKVARVIPDIVQKTETPQKMTLEVGCLKNLNTEGDSGLAEIAEQAKKCRMNHVLKAALPDEGNRRTANYLGNVMNGVYLSLYQKEEPFNADIVYKRGDKYVFRGQ